MNDKKINAIEIKNVTKIYRTGNTSVKALKGVDLTIYDNEFFTLLGPSGCGKTTLLRLIAGFEDITEGNIKLFNEEIISLPPNKRPVNTVFQHYALFPHLNIYENVAFALRRLNKDKDDENILAGIRGDDSNYKGVEAEYKDFDLTRNTELFISLYKGEYKLNIYIMPKANIIIPIAKNTLYSKNSEKILLKCITNLLENYEQENKPKGEVFIKDAKNVG